MKVGMYCMYDKVAKQAGPVFNALNHETASRKFYNTFKENTYMSLDDYDLHYLGDYDDQVPCVEHHLIVDNEHQKKTFYSEVLNYRLLYNPIVKKLEDVK